jgi:hypothetical protein
MKQLLLNSLIVLVCMAGMFAIMVLMFDSLVWEQDGHCNDAIVIHLLRECTNDY